MGVVVNVQSYADFKSVVAGFWEKGQVTFGPQPGGGGNFYMNFVGHKFDFLVTYSAPGAAPGTFAADFPTAIVGGTSGMYAAGF
jgi:hypothetical protein